MPNLHHTKSTAAEGRSVLLAIILTVVGLGMIQWFMFPWIWPKDPLFVILFLAIEIFVTAGVLFYATTNRCSAGEFVCYLDDQQLVCRCPVADCGESFSLAISQIDKLEKETWVENHRWYIWSKLGTRHWLTSNYDNPVEDFLDEIRRRSPGIEEIVA